MKAAVFEKQGILKIKDIEEPKITRGDDVIIKVEAASICGTDIHILSVPPKHPAKEGAVLGHEFIGKVVETGSEVKRVKKGDRTVCDPEKYCYSCNYCDMGYFNMCENSSCIGIFSNGGFAEYVVVPEKSLFKISNSIESDVAALINPLSNVIGGMLKVDYCQGQDVLILGAGPIGLMYQMTFKAGGIDKIIITEPSDYRQGIAKELGADVVINPKEKDVASEVKKITELGVDYSVDAVGSLMEDAILSTKRNGIVILMGIDTNARSNIQQSLITRNELKVLGSYCSNNLYPRTIKIVESGVLPLEKLITHRIGLDDILKGIEEIKSGKTVKIIVYP